MQDIDGGDARAIGDETMQAVLVSPDEKLLAGIGSGGGYVLRPVDGGETRPIRGALPTDDLIQWSADGRFLYMRAPGDSTLDFFSVNLANGRRELWKRIDAGDPVGLIGIQPGAVYMTPDGKSYAYSYWKTLTELYLVDNLK
jgi:eukaryotic-like serine/threonine-protein kinase